MYEEIQSLKDQINSLKQSFVQNETIIANQNREISDLKDIVVQLKNSLQDKESCYLSYFGPNQGDYPYKIHHVNANEVTRLPFYHMRENSIVSLEHQQEGSKITFKKSGMYLLMFNIMTSTSFEKNTRIRVYTTQGQTYSHYLNSYCVFQPKIGTQVVSGFKLCPYKEGDYIYVSVESPTAFDITGNSTVNTSFEIILTGALIPINGLELVRWDFELLNHFKMIYIPQFRIMYTKKKNKPFKNHKTKNDF